MANDLAAMIARIAAETARPDLAVGGSNEQRTRDAITTAISEYQKQRLRFNETSYSFNTVVGSFAYGAGFGVTADAVIPLLKSIDYVDVYDGSTFEEISRVEPNVIHLAFNAGDIGKPMEYAYESNTLIMWPKPDKVYTIFVGSTYSVAAPASDAEANNPWMTTGELLIRCRAKYELYSNLLRNDKEAARFSPDPGGNNGKDGETYRAFKSLKGEANRITGTGRIRPMRF